MSAVPPPARHSSRRWLARVLLVLGLVAVVVWQVRVHHAAWMHLKEARLAIEREDLPDARTRLDLCLETWPQKAEAHFLRAQVARQTGDLKTAVDHLAQAEQFGYDRSETDLQRSLIHAQLGHLAEVESALWKDLNEDRKESSQIAEVLVPLYLAEFRLVEANALTAKWVEHRPGSVKAWTYRADILERLRRKQEAIESLRLLARLVPEDRSIRLRLARLILEARQSPDEAASHLEWLLTGNPNDPAASLQLALCREAQGRTDEAAEILDRLIAGSTKEPKVYHSRGRLELNRGQSKAAAQYLRQAVELDSSDPELLYTLFQCIQQNGTPNEIREAEERWKRCDADLKRVGELARAIGASQRDPDLRREIGELFLRNGRTVEGLRWLESALRIQPDHAPTHQVLATYYERIGRPELAQQHRVQGPIRPPEPPK